MEELRIEPYTKAMHELIGRIVDFDEMSEGTDGRQYINTRYAFWCARVAMEIQRITKE